MQRKRSIDQPPEISDVNIVLFGLTKAGKSASGNTIIGGEKKVFKEGYYDASTTKICTAASTEMNRGTMTVIDTVKLYDTTVKKITDESQKKIEQIFDCTDSGFDVFLLVVRLGVKLSEEVSKSVSWIQENFGPKVLKQTIVLFTQGDQLHVGMEKYLSECEALRSVVDQCSGGFHVFNNKDEDRAQVDELLDKINKLRVMNSFRRYTEQDYKVTQDGILRRKCVTGVVVGGVLGTAGGAVIANMGVVNLTTGKAASSGAAIAALAAGVGVYAFARKYTPEQKHKI